MVAAPLVIFLLYVRLALYVLRVERDRDAARADLARLVVESANPAPLARAVDATVAPCGLRECPQNVRNGLLRCRHYANPTDCPICIEKVDPVAAFWRSVGITEEGGVPVAACNVCGRLVLLSDDGHDRPHPDELPLRSVCSDCAEWHA